jgi:hypothetical protein
MITLSSTQMSKIQSADELQETLGHNSISATVRVFNDDYGKFVDIELQQDNDVGVTTLLAEKGGWDIYRGSK